MTPEILENELIKYKEIIGERKIYVHPRAMIIKEKHREQEKQIIKSGSTFKGCGASQLIADAGISPFKVKDIIMIIRSYPIRIKCNNYKELPLKAKEFIHKIETETNTPVTMIGTGEKNCYIIDLRSSL